LTRDEFREKESYERDYLKKYHAERKATKDATKQQIGDTREDGKVYIGWSRDYEEENWVSSEEFQKIYAPKPTEKPPHPSLKNGTMTRGTKRADGKLFWQYRKGKNGDMYEKWVTPARFEANNSLFKSYRAKKELPTDAPKRGTVRDDGMVFLGVSLCSADPMMWVTPEKYEACKKSARDRHKKRYRKDPVFNLNQKLRAGLHGVLKSIAGRGAMKEASESYFFGILGGSMGEFKDHMESLFKEGMTWENYGDRWEVDHRIPCSRAKTVQEAAELFHKSNLQPLWREDNAKKGNRI
jgi:hypothetical protein